MFTGPSNLYDLKIGENNPNPEVTVVRHNPCATACTDHTLNTYRKRPRWAIETFWQPLEFLIAGNLNLVPVGYDLHVCSTAQTANMRGKRAKQYKKLMQQYGLQFGFREPYQVLRTYSLVPLPLPRGTSSPLLESLLTVHVVDADIIKDADKFKMDLLGGLERILHGTVKPMITQCSMRHLYAAAKEPGVSYVIDRAKTFERRRCGHLPEDYPEPLSAKDCITAVVDPKNTQHNKHRYVVASQDIDVRKSMRKVLGVPLIYINRSVMIMEPMAEATSSNRDREEKNKFRDGIKGRVSGSVGMKRKRGDDETEGAEGKRTSGADGETATKKKKVYGLPKGPNPLSVKKAKKEDKTAKPKGDKDVVMAEAGDEEGGEKKKRKRKHKGSNPGGGADGSSVPERQPAPKEQKNPRGDVEGDGKPLIPIRAPAVIADPVAAAVNRAIRMAEREG